MLASMDDRKKKSAATRIAREMRARMDVVAAHLGTVETLGGLCHFAALGVTQAMCSAGLDAFVASDGRHSWTEVELSSGLMLVDVTASQFGFVDVLIRAPGKSRPRVSREPPVVIDGVRHSRYRTQLYCTAVTGLVAQKLCAGVAAEVVDDAPHDWWLIPVHELPAALEAAGTKLGIHGRSIARRSALAAE